MNDKLTTAIRSILDEHQPVTKEQAAEITIILRDAVKAGNRLRLCKCGPCIQCGKPDIEYGQPCPKHVQVGDKWLESLTQRWPRPVEFSFQYPHVFKVNGLNLTTVERYCCNECVQVFAQKQVELEDAYKKRLIENERRAASNQDNRTDADIAQGIGNPSPSAQYWAMCRLITSETAEQLKSLSYSDFLATIYWRAIRRYKLYKSRYICQLCNAKGTLHVHHRTYVNHGQEHIHLEDLIVLCDDCHHKFHDKNI